MDQKPLESILAKSLTEDVLRLSDHASECFHTVFMSSISKEPPTSMQIVHLNLDL